ncbi:MAG: lmo0937 family membrane protein [Chthoniobacterales bacterium]
MLLIIAILLLLFWVGGLAFHIAGGLIHILIVIAVVMFILHFIRGKSA